MSTSAIHAEGLSKRYRIGARPESGGSLAARVTRTLASPFGYLRTTLRGPTDEETLWALRDVSFEVAQGEAIGVIGRNGAGKSTLLKVLARITEPTRGRATVRGRVGSLLEVGTGFSPELTGRENTFLNGAILGMRRAEISRKFDEIVAFSGVERFIDTPVKRYSSGMRLRLAFAVAAHLETEIMLIDEVLAVGDAEFQRRCLGKMEEVTTAGRTVLFVSHQLGAVQALTTRCIYLDDGRVVADGPTHQVITEYLSQVQGEEEIDYENARRSNEAHGTRVRITRIESVAGEAFGFRFNETLVFRITIRSAANVSRLCFGATIVDVGGTPVCSTFSDPVAARSTGGAATYELRIPGSGLAPGSYRLAVSAFEGSAGQARIVYDVVSHGPLFSVASVGEDGEQLFRWLDSYGHIYHRECEVTECASG